MDLSGQPTPPADWPRTSTPTDVELLRRAVEEAPMPMALLVGKEHRYQFANRCHRECFLEGHNPAGQTLLEVLPEVKEQGFEALLDDVYASGKTFISKDSSIALKRPDGTLRRVYFDFAYQPLKDASGKTEGIIATATDVTDDVARRKLAEEHNRLLRNERTNLQRLFENTENFFVLWRGPNFIYELSNSASDRIVGCNPLGRPLEEVVPDIRSSGVLAMLEEVYRTGNPAFIAEVAVEFPEGRRYFEATYIVHRDLEGNIDGIMAFGLDTTTRVRDRKQLKRSRADLSRAVQVAKFGFFDWNLTTDQIEMSDFFCQLFQIEPGATVEEMFSAIHPEEREYVRQKTMVVKQERWDTSFRYNLQHRLLRKDGSIIWLESLGQVTADEEGEMGHIFGTVRDITEAKEASHALALQQHFNESIINQAPAGIALLRGGGLTIEKSNSKWKEFLPEYDVAGDSVHHPDRDPQIQKPLKLIADALATEMPLRLKEIKIYRPQGDLIYAQKVYNFDASRICDGSGKPFGVVCQVTDMTEEVAARDQLKRVVDDLQAERVLRERFVTTLTHDMRTPLTAAKLSADMIVRKHADPNTALRMSQRIVRCIDRCESMARGLLDANRLKAGQVLPLHVAPCQIDEVVGQYVDELTTLHKRDFQMQTDALPVTGDIDKDAIRRILDNLAGNAVKYGEPQTPIRVTLRAAKSYVVLSVHNEGAPISLADQRTLFDAYTRSSSAVSSGQKGWGLGLSLVKGLAEAHGGQAHVHSAEGEGTTFFVTLPRHPGSLSASGTIRAHQPV